MGIKRFNSFSRLCWLVVWSIAWFAIVTVLWSFSGIITTLIYKILLCAGLTPRSLSSEMIKALFNGFGTILLGIGPAVVFWYYRDKTIHINHDQAERDLKLKEDNDAWANFIKYQKMAERESISEGRRAAAIYALGEYYRRQGSQFPKQVHIFFRKYLDKYWESISQYDHYQKTLKIYNDSQRESESDEALIKILRLIEYDDEKIQRELESDEALIETLKIEYDAAYKELLEPIKKIPEYIKAVHAVISSKSHEKVQVDRKIFNLFHYENKLFLSEFNLTGATLEKANLTGAELSSANLTGAWLRGTNLTGATLEKANLTGASLGSANLAGANLLSANLTGATLSSANLTGANLLSANLTGATLSAANLTGANLLSANLPGAKLDGANLTGATLSAANLTGANLLSANLPGAVLNSANLTEANLHSANLTGARLECANLTSAILSFANLTSANLFSATMTHAILFSATLTGANLNYTRTEATLNFATLTGAKLRKANLTRASLGSANLTGANLFSATLTGAKLVDTFIERNYAPTILFFKLFNVKKLGFECERLPGESKWRYMIRYFFRNLHFLFIQWNFKPDCRDAEYDESTQFPEWLDPAKAGMRKVPKEPEDKKEPEAPNVPDYGLE